MRRLLEDGRFEVRGQDGGNYTLRRDEIQTREEWTATPAAPALTLPAGVAVSGVADIPPMYLATTQVKTRVYNAETNRYESETVPAGEALAAIKQDIETLEAVRRCVEAG